MARERVAYTRREFLGTGLTLASAAAAVPAFLQGSALALPRMTAELSSLAGVAQDRVLVVVQLSGGNDGLNTVVPYGESVYYKARGGIGIPESKVLKLSKSDVGLHPALRPIADLHEEGLVGLVQGVGYPNPNRSHFKSMDIWHTADTSGTGVGWIGKYVDAECCGFGKGESGTADAAAAVAAIGGGGQPAIAIGREAPLAMKGHKSSPVSFETADLFRWIGKDVHGKLGASYDRITRSGVPAGTDESTNAAFLMRTALDAQVSSDTIRKAVAARPLAEYPQGNELARQLQMVASMIRAGLSTRVYYVTMGGFDTHSGQGGENGRHAQLLTQFGQAVRAFTSDLKAQGNEGRVLTMCFSEFGRRVYQNASGGTDHGTAAPVFLVGPMVKQGVITRHPSLTDLDEGDLKFGTDFRDLYAGVLSGWMGADAKAILGNQWKGVEVVRKA